MNTPQRKTRAKRSTGAIARARDIISQMRGKKRKEVLQACIEAGLNRNTAKTQWQVMRSRVEVEPETPTGGS